MFQEGINTVHREKSSVSCPCSWLAALHVAPWMTCVAVNDCIMLFKTNFVDGNLCYCIGGRRLRYLCTVSGIKLFHHNAWLGCVLIHSQLTTGYLAKVTFRLVSYASESVCVE